MHYFFFHLFLTSYWKPKALQLDRWVVALSQIWTSCSTEWPSLQKSSVLQGGAEHIRGKQEERGRLGGPKEVQYHIFMGQGKKEAMFLFLGSNVQLPLALLEGNCSCWLYFQQLVGLMSHLQRMRGTSINGKIVRNKTSRYKNPWHK